MSDRNAMVVFSQVRDMSQYLKTSSLLPADLRGKEADICMTIMAGHELGIEPMAALRGIHVVKGRPVLSADMMAGVVLASGKAEYFEQVESTAERAIYVTKRRGSQREQRATFTIEEARTAGLSGDNWKKYPAAMLRARAKSILARDAYPDALAGCYETDEARDFAPAGEVLRFEAPAVPGQAQVLNVEIEAEAAPAAQPPALLDEIMAAGSMAELDGLVPRIKALPEADRTAMRGAYRARRDELQAVSG
jgi:hypothetical protein